MAKSNYPDDFYYVELNPRSYMIIEKSTCSKIKMNFIATTRSEFQAKKLVETLNEKRSQQI